jgi:hypothetical protein
MTVIASLLEQLSHPVTAGAGKNSSNITETD